MAATDVGMRRLEALANPKPRPYGFIEDRRSVYWIKRFPYQPNPSTKTTDIATTPRIEELAKHKDYKNYARSSRPTPIWPVTKGARTASTSERLQQLAQEKTVHGDYKYHRSVYTEVTPEARNAQASPRLEFLAEPVPFKTWEQSNDTLTLGEISQPLAPVSSVAMRAMCSPRVESLAEAKTVPPSYKPERNCLWPVTENALNGVATPRVQQLARPRSSALKKDDYDPYKVSHGARLARASPRVQELCLPLPRKQRQKKTV